MITLGLVADVDADGIYVTLPGSRGVLRGPFETLQNVVAGDKVLVVTTDDGDCVVVGLAAAAVAGVSIPDGSITSAKIANGTIVDEDVSASAAIAKTKISGTAITAADTGTVTNAMLAGSIAPSKITGTAITAADSGTVTSAMIANSTIVDGDISGSAAISRSKISGLPTSSTDNTLPKFDSTGGALQTSGIVVDDNNRLRVASGSSGGLEIGASGPRIMAGTGSPESVVTAPVGSVWERTDGAAGSTFYLKQSGTGNTGWSPVALPHSAVIAGPVPVNATNTSMTYAYDPAAFYGSVTYGAGTSGNYFEWTVPLAGGTYTVRTLMYKGNNRGISDLTLNGSSLGTYDGYASGNTPNQLWDVTGVTVPAGLNTFRYTSSSKNASSSAYVQVIHGLLISKTA